MFNDPFQEPSGSQSSMGHHTPGNQLLQRFQPPQPRPPEVHTQEVPSQPSEPEADDGGYDDDAEVDDEAFHHQPGGHMSLEALLSTPGRDAFLERLSPTIGEGLWFDRDETVLVNKICKIMQDKFDGPYYSWRKTPTHVQERWFIQLALRYTWDPQLTALVREEFDVVAKRRLKGMINYVKTHRKRPNWIGPKLWEKMEAHWSSNESKDRSATTSTARNSDRDGLGPHKHVSGPKSHAQIQRDMEKELGRPVSLGEVFVRTHTRKDGTYVDEKARRVGDVYSQNLETTLSQLQPENSDAASEAPTLTPADMDAIFLKSTMLDARGNPYGIGRLARANRKGGGQSSLGYQSSKVLELEAELKEAKKKQEEQAAQHKLQMDMLLRYLKERDPNMPSWLEPSSSQQP